MRSACMRAVVVEGSDRDVEVRFRYLGPTERSEPLASGELRRQIGLKLLALDTCNVLYVMWHISPSTGIHVGLKSNPEAHEHRQCGDRGYVTVWPSQERAVRAIVQGEPRTLRARLTGRDLVVEVDGAAVWWGTVPEEALRVGGPGGLRTDNGQFDLTLRARGRSGAVGER